ncbi:MAG: cob(I)yrinic acid a,c-diamide adenosyltransferase [Ignavibacteria bacterium]|nr:cob(I)yrinic acid a,c-diamide adenosyltransferase [Ignavibacteria bacterium]
MENKNTPGGKKYKEKIMAAIENYGKLKPEEKNCLHLYYGYGKGKTTSAIGLAIRALGAGKKVAIVQFDKGYDGTNEHYSERNVIRKLKEIGYEIDIYPTGCERMNEDGTFRFKNEQCDFDEAKKGLEISKKLIKEGKQDLLILDESVAAVAYNLLQKTDIKELIDLFHANKRYELVMTGHKIWGELEEKADLITEMRKVKHYFDKGIPARQGIEY